jgi:heme/copper-type cytochrome/quinol oxidase subunit 2
VPLVKTLLLNPEMVDLERIEDCISDQARESQFKKLIQTSTWLVAISFGVSAILNYVLARIVVTSPSNTPEFNDELAKMQGLSYIVIFIPSMAILIVALYRLYNGITRMTGLQWDEFIRGAKKTDDAPEETT